MAGTVARSPSKPGTMTRQIRLNLTEDEALRLTALADAYNTGPIDLAGELLLQAIIFCEQAIEQDACDQIAWLAEVAPQGRA